MGDWKGWRFITANMDVICKYKKAPNKLLAPQPKLKMRTEEGVLVKSVRVVTDSKFLWKGKVLATETKLIDSETGERVASSEALEILEHFQYKNLDADGKEIDKEDICYFTVQEDGSETQVKAFARSNMLNIPEENWIPSLAIEGFLIDSVYELFSEKKDVARELFAEAERRLKKDQIGVTTWSWGGFKQVYAFLCPFVREGQFVWLVKFSEYQPEYVQLQEIPTKAKVPLKEIPTLKTLPPVQALVVVSRK